MFARDGGGRIDALLVMLPAELDGREVAEVVLRVVGLTGSLLGD